MVAGHVPFDERTSPVMVAVNGRHLNIAKSQEPAQEEKSKVHMAAIRQSSNRSAQEAPELLPKSMVLSFARS
jgi:hypothetical protein